MPTRTLRDGEKYELQQLLEAPGKAGTKGTYNGCEWHRVKSKGETTWKLRDLGAPRWQVFASSQEAVAWVAGEPPDTGPRGESSYSSSSCTYDVPCLTITVPHQSISWQSVARACS